MYFKYVSRPRGICIVFYYYYVFIIYTTRLTYDHYLRVLIKKYK